MGVGIMVVRAPIALAFGLATLPMSRSVTTTPTMVIVGRMDEGMSHLILLAVPLHVLSAC